MQPTQPLSCWSCGTVLSATGGRCPACGAEQPSGPAPLGAPPALSRPPRPVPAPPRTAQKAAPWALLAVGLAAIGLVAVLFAPEGGGNRGSERVAPSAVPSAPERPADPNDLGIADPKAVDPTEILGRARARALAWDREAVLVSLRAQPLVGGRVNLTTGGSVRLRYGKPTGEGFGSGAKTAGPQLEIAIASAGTTVEAMAAGPARAAQEPNCPLDEAVAKAIASGVPTGSALEIAYEVSDKHGKAAWKVSVPDSDVFTRLLDGWTCAILVR